MICLLYGLPHTRHDDVRAALQHQKPDVFFDGIPSGKPFPDIASLKQRLGDHGSRVIESQEDEGRHHNTAFAVVFAATLWEAVRCDFYPGLPVVLLDLDQHELHRGINWRSYKNQLVARIVRCVNAMHRRLNLVKERLATPESTALMLPLRNFGWRYRGRGGVQEFQRGMIGVFDALCKLEEPIEAALRSFPSIKRQKVEVEWASHKRIVSSYVRDDDLYFTPAEPNLWHGGANLDLPVPPHNSGCRFGARFRLGLRFPSGFHYEVCRRPGLKVDQDQLFGCHCQPQKSPRPGHVNIYPNDGVR